MKTAMKKLLSLMLVAVLLVSAVPFQASATVDTRGVLGPLPVPVDVYINGKFETSKTLNVSGTVQLNETTAKSLITTWENDTMKREYVNFTNPYGGVETTLSDAGDLYNQLNNGYRLNLNLTQVEKSTTAKKVDIVIYVNDEQKPGSSMTVDVAGVTLTNALGQQHLGNAGTFQKWAKADATDITGSTFTKDNVPDTLYLYGTASTNPTNPTNPGNVNVNVTYTYGGKTYTTTITVPAGTNVTADMIAQAIKNQLGNQNLNVTVTAPGTVNGNVNVNATVQQPAANQVCLTINFSGSFSGVAQKFVNPGTWVYASDVKNAVATASGRSASTFTMSDPFASKQMNVSETISVTVTLNSTSNPTDKFPESVYLAIWSYGNVSSPIKTIKLDNYNCVKNGTVYLETDVRSIILNSYTAKDSNGIKLDGLYVSDGRTAANYVKDEAKQSSVNVAELRKNGVVYLNVWIDNYKAKTSSNADPSNPKTGDTIVTTVTIMSLSIASLAAVYYISKKRAVR